MNKQFLIGITSACCLVIGIIYFCVAHHIVVIRYPLSIENEASLNAMKKRECSVYYWHDNGWVTEKIYLLSSANDTYNIKQLINGMFGLLVEEQLINKKVNVESVLLSENNNDLYVSFSRSPFSKNEPIFEKWMRIEGILKTIRSNHKTINNVRFLLQHKPLHDTHLDFSQPWPIKGFVEN